MSAHERDANGVCVRCGRCNDQYCCPLAPCGERLFDDHDSESVAVRWGHIQSLTDGSMGYLDKLAEARRPSHD